MKKKILTVFVSLTVAAALAGCSVTDDTAQDTSAASKDTVNAEADSTYSGTVTAADETSVTVETDTEYVVITFSDDTVFTYGMSSIDMSSGPGGADSQADDISDELYGDDEGTEGSSGDTSEPDGSGVPEKPEGEDDADDAGSPPEVPGDEGDMADMGDAPEAPGGEGDMADMEDAPEVPGGEGDMADVGDAPEAPGGEGYMPDMGDALEIPDGGGEMAGAGAEADLTWESINTGDEITVTTDENCCAETVTLPLPDMSDMSGGGGAGGGSASGVDSYDAANEYTEDTTVSDTTLSSGGTDENTVLVSNGASVTLDSVTITRDSDDSTGGDNSSFYGVGAAALVTDGTLTIQNSTIESDAAGGAGVFAYGDGIAYVSDTVITTKQDTSGGIHVAGGGTLYARDLDVTTAGGSSAAIRSDRGSGVMVVDGGTYTSNGTGSPAVYSTADITVNDAELTANNSEAVCIEGFNTIRLFDCDLYGNMNDDSQNDCTWTVILYQSMSGDSEEGLSTFKMSGGTLTSGNGGIFYTTNTESEFVISDVDITASEDCEFFLKVTGNSNQRGWGSSGSNGADCTFTAISQEMNGDVIWDSISELDLYILDGSTLTGAVSDDESNAGNGGSGYAALYIDSSSTWVVTGDSTVTDLYCAGTIVDENGGTVTITGTDGTVYVQGTGSIIITTENYTTSVDTSGAGTPESFSDYEVDW